MFFDPDPPDSRLKPPRHKSSLPEPFRHEIRYDLFSSSLLGQSQYPSPVPLFVLSPLLDVGGDRPLRHVSAGPVSSKTSVFQRGSGTFLLVLGHEGRGATLLHGRTMGPSPPRTTVKGSSFTSCLTPKESGVSYLRWSLRHSGVPVSGCLL